MLPAELPDLDECRLSHNWTWAELGDAMRRRDLYVSPTTLHFLVKRARADVRVSDRTVYKIRKFLEVMKAEDERAKSRPSRRAARAAAH